jgi:uncharacterized protein (TIGR02118 family)
MIKAITWFKRTPGMELGDFRRYWREEHPKAVLQLPGIRKYVQNHVHDSAYRSGEPFADGVAETWWDDLGALMAHHGTPALDALMIDEQQFIDPDHRDQLVAEEVVLRPVGIPVDGLKQIVFVKRRPDLSIDEGLAYWRDVHGPMALDAPGLGRYVQNHALRHRYVEGRSEPTYDGATMAWFADVEAARQAGSSPVMAAVADDQRNFMDGSPVVMLSVVEHHII